MTKNNVKNSGKGGGIYKFRVASKFSDEKILGEIFLVSGNKFSKMAYWKFPPPHKFALFSLNSKRFLMEPPFDSSAFTFYSSKIPQLAAVALEFSFPFKTSIYLPFSIIRDKL